MACDFSMYTREVFCIRIVVTQREVVMSKQCVLCTEYDKSHKLYLIHIYAGNPWSDAINLNEHVFYNLLLALCYIFCNVLLHVLLQCNNDVFFSNVKVKHWYRLLSMLTLCYITPVCCILCSQIHLISFTSL